MSPNEAKLLEALRKGPVRNMGDIICDINAERLMARTELYHAVRGLNEAGINVERIDSGGNPTWGIIASGGQA